MCECLNRACMRVWLQRIWGWLWILCRLSWWMQMQIRKLLFVTMQVLNTEAAGCGAIPYAKWLWAIIYIWGVRSGRTWMLPSVIIVQACQRDLWANQLVVHERIVVLLIVMNEGGTRTTAEKILFNENEYNYRNVRFSGQINIFRCDRYRCICRMKRGCMKKIDWHQT